MKRFSAVVPVAILALLAIHVVRVRRDDAQQRTSASAVKAAPAISSAAAALSRERALDAYGKLPLTFERNEGQTDSRVNFLARGSGYSVFLTGSDATIRLDALDANSEQSNKAGAPEFTKSSVVRVALANSNAHSTIEELEPQTGRSNYFIGNDPANWHRGIPQFGRVKYCAVYPGVDLIYYGNQGKLESDYEVAPGADPGQIALQISGADKLGVDAAGDLAISTVAGDIFLRRPRAYQASEDATQEVAANYVLGAEQQVHIQLGPYDAQRPLIIDPVLSYATYLGGATNQTLAGIAVDATGFAYITGFTSSTDYPVTAGVVQTTAANTKSAVIVTKLKQDGSGLVYSTLLSGTGAQGDFGRAIAVDSTGDAYVVGFTSSTDFPIIAGTAYQSVNRGGGGFFTELDPAGANLLYSTYLSGTGTDRLQAVAVDVAGNAYITGATTSTDFPLVAGTAIQNINNVTGSQIGTAFLSRINPSQVGLGSLVYSTFLGGTKEDSGLGVAVNSSNNAFITGYTKSSDFPMTATNTGFQTTLKNTIGGNAFVARIDTSQPNTLVYSTFLGGTPNGSGSNPGEVGSAVALGPSGDAYITGYSYATDYPLVGALDSVSNTPNQKAIVTRVDTTKSGASSLVYSSYFGGTRLTLLGSLPGVDLGFGIAVDPTGNVYLAGTSRSADFPVTPGAPQSAIAGTQNAFVAELNPAGSAVLFGTFLGGSIESANGIALDHATPANAYVAGVTSGNFPTTPGAFQTVDNVTGANNTDGFVAKVSPGAVTGVFATPSSLNFGTQPLNVASTPKIVTLLNLSGSAITITGPTFSGPNLIDFSQPSSTCGATLAAGSSCTYSVVFTPSVSGSESATMSIIDSDATSPQIVALTGIGGGGGSTPDFTLALNPTTATVTAGGNATFTAGLASINSFAGTVALTCTGAPPGSTCSLSPASVPLTANGTGTSAGTVTTTLRTIAPPSSFRQHPRFPTMLWTLLGITLCLFAAWIATRRGARKLAWGFAAFALLAVSSCSGVPHQGTPVGVYTITVTGTSGTLTHTATVSLTVN